MLGAYLSPFKSAEIALIFLNRPSPPGTLFRVAVVVFYMLLCAVRYSMPGISAKDRNRILLMRVTVGLVGAGLAYLFMYAVFLAKGHLVRDPMFAQKIALCIFLGFVIVSEFFARRQIKRLKIFPTNRPIPWTY